MLPISELEPECARALAGVVFDVDDTLTRHGRVEAEAYAALWRLREAGLHTIAVTGRPLGFAEIIARYLKAIALRLDKYANNPERDASRQNVADQSSSQNFAGTDDNSGNDIGGFGGDTSDFVDNSGSDDSGFDGSDSNFDSGGGGDDNSF